MDGLPSDLSLGRNPHRRLEIPEILRKNGDGVLAGEQLFQVRADAFEQGDRINDLQHADVVESMRRRMQFYVDLEEAE